MNRRWQRARDFSFIKDQTVVMIVGKELPKAILSMPAAFVEIDGVFHLTALLGLDPGTNLFVMPDGRWRRKNYIPAILRGHPFRIIDAASGKRVLGVDEDSGLVGDDGERFFTDQGTPAPEFQAMIDFQKELDRDFKQTRTACDALTSHHLLQPWPGMPAGLHRVDVDALNRLAPEPLAEVRNAGGLNVAFCQLISQQQVARLKQFQAETGPHHPGPIPDSGFTLTEDSDLKIDWDAI
jgi:hypothetical protein